MQNRHQGKPAAAIMSGYRVLIVEDEAFLAEAMATALRGHGYSVTTADTKAEALAYLRDNSVDLLIMDTNLPDGNGWQIIDEARGKNLLEATKVIAISANRISRSQIEASSLHKYIAKPFDMAYLLAVVDDAANISSYSLQQRHPNRNEAKKGSHP